MIQTLWDQLDALATVLQPTYAALRQYVLAAPVIAGPGRNREPGRSPCWRLTASVRWSVITYFLGSDQGGRMQRQVVTEEEGRRNQQRARGRAAEVGGGVAAGAGAPPADAEGQPGQHDTFADRLLKYIPAEVVAVYITLDGLFRAAPPPVPKQTLLWVVFVVLTIATWFYLARVQKVAKVEQLAISTIAFIVWVFSLGGPFSAYPWYTPFYGAVLLPLYTFLVPILEAKR